MRKRQQIQEIRHAVTENKSFDPSGVSEDERMCEDDPDISVAFLCSDHRRNDEHEHVQRNHPDHNEMMIVRHD